MFQIRLLGEQVLSDTTGAPLALSPRTVALLGYLVLHAGVPQHRGRIATLFWPDSTDDQALTNLRRELHHLRGVLADEPALSATSRELCWRDTHTCVVHTCVVEVREFSVAADAGAAAARAGKQEEALEYASAALTARSTGPPPAYPPTPPRSPTATAAGPG